MAIKILVMVVPMDPILHLELMAVMVAVVAEAGMVAMAQVIECSEPRSIAKVVSLSCFSLSG